MGYRRAAGPNGEAKYFRTAIDNEGNQQFLEVSEDMIPPAVLDRLNGKTPSAPSNKTKQDSLSARNRYRQTKKANQAQATWEEIASRGPVAAEMKRNARAMPWGEKFAVQSMLEAQKLAAGMGDIGDFLDDVIPEPIKRMNPGYILKDLMVDEKDPIQRTIARRKEQSEKDAMDQYIHQEAGSAKLGAAIPYLLSGRYTSKPAEYVASRLVEKPAEMVAGLGRTSVTKGKNIFEKVEHSERAPKLAKQLAKEVNRDYIKPAAEISDIIKKRPSIIPTESRGAVKDIVGSGLQGMVEGGIHYDMDMLDGGLASAGGASFGKLLNKWLDLENIKPVLSEPVKEDLDFWLKEGYRLDPGMTTGSSTLKKKSRDFMDAEEWAPFTNEIKFANRQVISDVAADAMGIPRGEFSKMSRSNLSEYADSLKNQYETLEKTTKGRFLNSDLTALSEDLSHLLSKKGYKAIKEDYERITKIIQTQSRGQGGRFGHQSFSGTDYQQVRRILKRRLDQAYKKSDYDQVDAYTKMVQFMDDSLERGFKAGNEVALEQWKDLNEKYAMSKIVLNNGMNEINQIDTGKLSSFLMSTDAERLLKGKGSERRIGKLHKIASLNRIMKDPEYKGFTREVDPQWVKENSKALTEIKPSDLRMGRLKELQGRMIYGGVPNALGYLGWTAKGLPGRKTLPMPDIFRYERGTTSALSRAASQGTQPPSAIKESAKGLTAILNLMGINSLDDFFKQTDKYIIKGE